MKIYDKEKYDELCQEIAGAMTMVAVLTFQDNIELIDKTIAEATSEVPRIPEEQLDEYLLQKVREKGMNFSPEVKELSDSIELMIEDIVFFTGKTMEEVMADVEHFINSETASDMTEANMLRKQNRLN